MAAYAALVSLMNTMEQILNHPRLSTSLDRKQIESLQEKVGFLQDFIEGYNSHGVSNEAEVLEGQIARAAHSAEDAIESHVVDKTFGGSPGPRTKSSSFLLDLQKVIQDMHDIKEKATKVKEKRGFKDQQPTYSLPDTSSRPLTTKKNSMVGFDDYLIQLMEGLTGQQSNLRIIPIVGMGGIGKTTLARNAYENVVIVQHFYMRAWATIYQEYSIREILLELLFCQRKVGNSENFVAFTNEMDPKTEDQLGEQLYKSLSGMRYLIILDDMWSIEVWDKIKFFFPDNKNGSRIVVTTRLSNVASHFGSSHLAMTFLDEDKSWNLFCEMTFPGVGCPPDLVEIGQSISKKCKGLPLSIVVIGGLIGKSSRTRQYWENVEKDINSILSSGDDEQCLNILSLSYSYLPVRLKPCFLYLGNFPKGHEIRVSRLIKHWVALGFLKSNESQSMEEVAEVYLKDLIDMNLILVCRLRSNGKIKSCNIHDLLSDLCLRIAKKEKFFWATKVPNRKQGVVFRRIIPKINKHPRIFDALQSILPTLPLLFEGSSEVQNNSLEALFQRVSLRYLDYRAITFSISKLPSSISLLWSVQTIIIRVPLEQIVAPSEIWEMPQLRHLKVDGICLPDPPSSNRVDQQDVFVLRNLQTLMKVVNFRWSEEVCKRIPNIKKLHITYDYLLGKCEEISYYCVYNLGRFHKLESLNCLFDERPNRRDLLQNLRFPSSLQKLSLTNCRLHWEDLSMIGLLPNLEVLKLGWDSVKGLEWNVVEGEFLCLKFLEIYCTDLIYWDADSSHFPVLENLVLHQLIKLDEIPIGIGEIPTLRVIHLDCCSESAAISAVKILEEQESLGNEGLQVRLMFWDKAELERFREKVELQSFTSNNFLLTLRGGC